MSTGHTDWRGQTRRQIGWMLLIKLAALIGLWALFFSPRHRVEVTPDAVEQQLAPAAPAASESGD